MQVGLLIPQGWKGEYDGWDPADAWARTVDLARHAEELGFESEWVFDHFTTVPEPTDEITFESFSTLSALAMVTERVRIGHMVVCTGFRNPALTAKLSSTIDVISGGRFELGIGAGWKEDEWLAYGYGFPPTNERLAQFGDHLEVISRMLAPGRATLRRRVRPRPRRDQRAEGHPAAAHPDHRRRQWPERDDAPRRPVRRRAQPRLPADRRDPRSDRDGAAAVRGDRPGPGDAPAVAVHRRSRGPRGGVAARRPARPAGRDRPRSTRRLPDAVWRDPRGAGEFRRRIAEPPDCSARPGPRPRPSRRSGPTASNSEACPATLLFAGGSRG